MRGIVLVFLVACGGDKDGGDSGGVDPATSTGSTPAGTTPTGSTPTGTTGAGSTPTGTTGAGTTPTGTTGTGTPTPAMIVDAHEVSLHSVGLTAQFSVALSAAAPLSVECTTLSSPADLLVVTSPAASEHQVTVPGLLADSTWTCVLATADDSTDLQVIVPPLPEDFPTWVIESPGTPWGTYTAFDYWTHREGDGQTRTIIVDPEGRPRWFRDRLEGPDPGIEVKWTGDELVMAGGGSQSDGLPPMGIGLDGQEHWRFPYTADGAGIWHHDVIVLDDGTVMSMAESENVDGDGDTFTGLRIEARDPATGEITWSWDSQASVDAGVIPAKGIHGNALQVVEDERGTGLWVSAKLIDALFRIDMATGAITDRVGVGGDFTLLHPSGEELGDEEWFYGQHAPEFRGDRVLMYDNGVRSPLADDEKHSRALELELDMTARTATVVWSYTEDFWLEPNWGDADRLPNGDTFITIGHCWSCDDNGGGRTRLVEVDGEGAQVWRLVFDGSRDAVYRSDRLDGCALFNNRRYCDE